MLSLTVQVAGDPFTVVQPVQVHPQRRPRAAAERRRQESVEAPPPALTIRRSRACIQARAAAHALPVSILGPCGCWAGPCRCAVLQRGEMQRRHPGGPETAAVTGVGGLWAARCGSGAGAARACGAAGQRRRLPGFEFAGGTHVRPQPRSGGASVILKAIFRQVRQAIATAKPRALHRCRAHAPTPLLPPAAGRCRCRTPSSPLQLASNHCKSRTLKTLVLEIGALA